MSDNNQKLVIAAGFILALLILAFGWPTRYRYDTLRDEWGRNFVMRTNRFTDKTQRNYGQGWVPKPVSTGTTDPWAAAFDRIAPAPATTPAQPPPAKNDPWESLVTPRSAATAQAPDTLPADFFSKQQATTRTAKPLASGK